MIDPAIADNDARFMRAAIALGARELGRTWPNPAVGALVVSDGVVCGRGWTQAGGRPHAETMALAEARGGARGATLYVSLEPCSHHGRTPPCADAIIEAGIARVVSAMEDPNTAVAGRGHQRLRDAGIEVVTGVLKEEARRVHCGHVSRHLKNRPHVTLKSAVSADGKAALAGRRPAPITGAASLDLVHRMRGCHDAIAIGIGTAMADDPMLTVRLPGMEDRSPVRVIFDSSLRLPLTGNLVMSAREVPIWLVAETGAKSDASHTFAPHGIEVLRAPLTEDGVDLAAALQLLASRGLTRLMVEGGPSLAASFVRHGLVDEAVVMQSPDALGPDAVDAFPAPHQDFLAQAGLNLRRTQRAGEDAVFLYERP